MRGSKRKRRMARQRTPERLTDKATNMFPADETTIETALQDPRVEALYQEVNSATPVSFKYAESDTWWSSTVGNKTTIQATPTTHPAACLAHELLHAKLKINGYRQYTVSVSCDARKTKLPDLLSALDNELQHHRMFLDFDELGFPATEFYHDSDYATLDIIVDRIKLSKRAQHAVVHLMTYLTVIAPGGTFTPGNVNDLESLFQKHAGPQNWETLQAIKGEILSWRDGGGVDPGPTLIKILHHLGCFNRTWIGKSTMLFPETGHFIDQSFTLDDARASDWK